MPEKSSPNVRQKKTSIILFRRTLETKWPIFLNESLQISKQVTPDRAAGTESRRQLTKSSQFKGNDHKQLYRIIIRSGISEWTVDFFNPPKYVFPPEEVRLYKFQADSTKIATRSVATGQTERTSSIKGIISGNMREGGKDIMCRFSTKFVKNRPAIYLSNFDHHP